METNYYSEFSQQRADLRKEWNGKKTDWEVYLHDANFKALKVADALNKNINNFSHLEIVENYNFLYKVKECFMQNENLKIQSYIKNWQIKNNILDFDSLEDFNYKFKKDFNLFLNSNDFCIENINLFTVK